MTFTYTPGPPVVATASATDVTSDTALLNGILYYLGEVGSVNVSFEWGFDTNYGNETLTEAMSSTGSFSAVISGLVPGSTYHFRAKGVGDGTGYGDDMTFVAQADEVWVDDEYTAGGFNDGHTWGIDAFNTIQEGIDIVASPGTVHVAPGSYNDAITLRNGVKILGAGAGFDPAVHAIIDGSDLWEAAVVTARNIDSTATLDGLTIVNGNGDMYLGFGGGMYNYQSSPTVSNCIFSGNEVGLNSGGSGGGMCNDNSSPTVINCIFSDNKSWGNGGGMFNYQSIPMLINCTFSENEATGSGGGIVNSFSEATITNTVLWGNSAYQENEVFNTACAPFFRYCDIQQSSGIYPGTGNINSDPLFVDPGNGDYRIQPGSPCIDFGSNNAVPPEIITDFEGDSRIIDGDDIPGAIVDMGADEYVLTGTECQGDFDGDGDVDGSDLAVFAVDFGRTDCGAAPPCEGDFDADGDVDGSDLAVFAVDFGRTDCP